ncbi:hypothetical protein FQA39_LY16625 [Lamprigera yunnana]|nr:hypothetical protein FQA39_LY16625 [Lamprigera yunnana]
MLLSDKKISCEFSIGKINDGRNVNSVKDDSGGDHWYEYLESIWVEDRKVIQEVTTLDKEMNINHFNVEKSRRVIQKVTTLDKQMNINNFNIEEDDENVNLCEENKISEEIYDEEKKNDKKIKIMKKVLPDRHWKLSQMDEEGYGMVLNQVKEILYKIREKYMRQENAKIKKKTSFEHRKKENERRNVNSARDDSGMNFLSQYGLVIDLDKRCIKWENGVKYFVEEDRKVIQEITALDKKININHLNMEENRRVIQEVTTLDKEMNINNFNNEEDDENVNLCQENKIYDEEEESDKKKENIEAYKSDEKSRKGIQEVKTLDNEIITIKLIFYMIKKLS